MKKNQAVLNRVHKFRERRGLKVVDTDSKVFKAFKISYIVAFGWYLLIHLFYFVGEALVLSTPEASQAVYMEQFYMLCGGAIIAVVGFILVLCNKFLIGGIFNIISAFLDTYQFYVLLVLRNKDFDSTSKLVVRHILPACLLIVCCMVVCGIALRAKHLFNRDYNRVLEALYVTYKDRLHSGSEEEWERLLTELDDQTIETNLEKHHTASYFKNKSEKSRVTGEKVDANSATDDSL